MMTGDLNKLFLRFCSSNAKGSPGQNLGSSTFLSGKKHLQMQKIDKGVFCTFQLFSNGVVEEKQIPPTDSDLEVEIEDFHPVCSW